MVKSDIIYFVVLPPAQHHSFFRNLLLLFLPKHTQTPLISKGIKRPVSMLSWMTDLFIRIWAIFISVKSNPWFPWFHLTPLFDWCRKTRITQTETNHDLGRSRLKKFACFYFDFSLAPCDIFLPFDWLLKLLWYSIKISLNTILGNAILAGCKVVQNSLKYRLEIQENVSILLHRDNCLLSFTTAKQPPLSTLSFTHEKNLTPKNSNVCTVSPSPERKWEWRKRLWVFEGGRVALHGKNSWGGCLYRILKSCKSGFSDPLFFSKPLDDPCRFEPRELLRCPVTFRWLLFSFTANLFCSTIPQFSIKNVFVTATWGKSRASDNRISWISVVPIQIQYGGDFSGQASNFALSKINFTW